MTSFNTELACVIPKEAREAAFQKAREAVLGHLPCAPGQPFSPKYAPADLEESVEAPCARCGEFFAQNLAAYKQWGAGCCGRCARAYFCFQLSCELLKAGARKESAPADKRNLRQLKMAKEGAGLAAKKFKSQYGADWEAHLKKIFPHYKRVKELLAGFPDARRLLIEGKVKGWL